MQIKRIDTHILGAICLIVGWGTATLLHEGCHLAVARSLGLRAVLEHCTLTTGSVFIQGDMTNIETAMVAIAGSAGLIIIGVLLTKQSNKYHRMIGVVFLCRAWTDAIPVYDLDGGQLAGSAGYSIAVLIVTAEVLICGSGIINTMKERPKIETITNR